MKILVLSCDTGEGHNSAAKAFIEYLKQNDIAYEMKDTLSLVSPGTSQKVSDIYVFSTRTNLFKYVYKVGEAVSDGISSKSAVYLASKLYCRKLYDYIENNGFDVIVCTHLFPAEALTALRRTGTFTKKTIYIMTDYTCIPFTRETELDAYIVPHEHLIEECVNKGLPREKLFPFGIPVKSAFHTSYPKEYARIECLKSLGVEADKDKIWFLLMSGSMGFGNSTETVKKLIAARGGDIELFLVCGNNAKLKQKLSATFSDVPSVHILGFTDIIPLLMDACDVLFTKPGGLSSTEAAAKGIPMIHTAPIPGCETRNAEFFHYHNMSYSSVDTSYQVEMAFRLVDDEEFRRKMIVSQKLNSNPDTCRQIFDLCKQQGTDPAGAR